MKKLFLLSFVLFFFSCDSLSTEELAKNIKQDMIDTFAESDDWVSVKFVDFSLVHKGGNEYKGIVELIVENPVADLFNNLSEQEIFNEKIEVSYPVEVIYDGTNYSWEILTD